MPGKLASGKIDAGVSYKYMLLHLLIYVGASKRKRENVGARQDSADGWTREDATFGAHHNTVSLLCQIGLDRRTKDIGWGNEIFVLVGACCRKIGYIAIEVQKTHARSTTLSPLVNPALLQTTINSWI